MDTTATAQYDTEVSSEIITEVQNKDLSFDEKSGVRTFIMTYITVVIDNDGNVNATRITEKTVGGEKSNSSEKVELSAVSKKTQAFINKSISHLKATGSSYVQMQLKKSYQQDRAKNDLVNNILSGGSILNRFAGVSKVLRAFWGAFTVSYKYFSKRMIKENNRNLQIK